MIKTGYVTLAAALILLAVPAWATENVTNAAGQAWGLENANGSARTKAMGSAVVGLADDPTAMLSNAAGLGNVERTELSLHHNSWLVDTYQETAVVGFPVHPGTGLGLAFNYLDYGTMESRDSTGVDTGSYTATSMGLAAALGFTMTGNFLGGIALKASQRTLADTNYNSLAADLGVLCPLPNGARLGASWTNLGAGPSGTDLTSVFRAGGSWNIGLGKQDHVILAADVAIGSNNTHAVRAGGEWTLLSALALRGGYQLSLDENALQGLNSVTAGVGFFIQDFLLDYTYLPFGDLGSSQRVSATYRFASPAPASKP